MNRHARTLALALAAVAATSLAACNKPASPEPSSRSGPTAAPPPSGGTSAPTAATPTPAPATGPAASVADKPAGPLDPSVAKETAPAVFKAKLETTKGDVVIEVHRDWSPNGADRFYNLVKSGFYTDVAIFRVIKTFMAQFGIHGNPEVSAAWREAQIPDDPAVGQSNQRGFVSFAMAGPNSRTSQLFISYKNNANLDGMGFTPIGKVVEGMDVVDRWEGQYGEGAPRGRGPSQGRMQAEGNTYLKAEFPALDYIKSASILP